MSKKSTIIILGGGAAGFFGAIACAEANRDNQVIILEKARQVLAKVRISGGGRCNVTHSCFEPALLVNNYPRGSKALRGPFSRFQPRDTVQWFESKGVPLKVEGDGRMFPTTDNSETIINCLMTEAKKAGVLLRNECGVSAIEKSADGFRLTLSNDEIVACHKLLIATGSNAKVLDMVHGLGHQIVPAVPSLFTFNIPNSPLVELSGISVPKAHVKIDGTSLEQTGPLLITHWGFSGPAVLKLSAWGARVLHDVDYKATVCVNWLPDYNQNQLREIILAFKGLNLGRQVASDVPVALPKTSGKSLWKALMCAGRSYLTSSYRSCSSACSRIVMAFKEKARIKKSL